MMAINPQLLKSIEERSNMAIRNLLISEKELKDIILKD